MYLIECHGDTIVIVLDGENVFLYECLLFEGYDDVVAEVYSIDLLYAKCIVYGNIKNLKIGLKLYRKNAYLSFEFNKSKIGQVLDPLLKIVSNIYQNAQAENNANIDVNNIFIRKSSMPIVDITYNPIPTGTGIKVIDFFLPYAYGGKMGIVGGAGVGKTTFILDMITSLKKEEHFYIFSGVGERMREGRALYMDVLSSGLIDKDNPNDSFTSLIYGTMDQTAAMRALALLVAVALAELTRDYYNMNTIMVVDNVFRFNQAMMELVSSMKVRLSELGYHPNLYSSISHVMEKIVQKTLGNSITGIFAIFVPADNPTDPGVLSCVDHMDTMVYLDRNIAKQKRFPAVNILSSTTNLLTAESVGNYHITIYKKAIALLKRYEEISEIINIIGEDNLSDVDKKVVCRARIIYAYMTQALSVSSTFNNMEPHFVDIKDTIADMDKIMSGSYDNIDPNKFLYIGKI